MLEDIVLSLKEVIGREGCVTRTQGLLQSDSEIEQPFSDDSDVIVIINPNSASRILVRPGQALLVISTAGNAPVGVVEGYDVITVDQEQGAMMAGQRMRQAGVRSVSYIGRRMSPHVPGYVKASEVRLRGFEAGWGDEVPRQHQFYAAHYAMDDGALIAAQYARMKDRPDAVFAASDELAVGFVLGLIPFGLKAGRDYSIIGFDGQRLGQELRQGTLSTIKVPTKLMGRRGGELLLDRLRHPHQPVRRLSLGCSWLEGATIISKNQASESLPGTQ